MQCGPGLDSRGGHENDGKRKTRTTQGMTLPLPLPLPLRHSRALPGNPVLSHPSTRQAGNPPPLIPKNTQHLPAVILAEGGNPECGPGLDSRGGHENDGGGREADEGGAWLMGGGRGVARGRVSGSLVGAFPTSAIVSPPSTIMTEGGGGAISPESGARQSWNHCGIGETNG